VPLIRNADATLALELFNNSVSHTDGSGFRIDDFAPARLRRTAICASRRARC